MLRLWAFLEFGATFCLLTRLGLRALVLAPITNQEETQNAARDQPCSKSLHKLPRPHAHKPQSHHHDDMKNGEKSKSVAEWPMDHVPEVKYPLRLIEKKYAL